MTGSEHPPPPPPPPPATPPPPQPARTPYQTARPQGLPPRDGKPVSFYLAIFLALLLFVSGGLNLLLLFFSAIGSATSGLTGGYVEEFDGMYEVVATGGDADASDRILRVPITGAISEGQSALIGASGGTVSQLKRALRVAANDSSIKGVLLDINSPGGGVTDSDEMHRLITEFREEHEKPVLALLGDIAASGGYYVAVGCNQIMARPTTITGSIGVIMQSFNFAELAREHGVKQNTIVSDRTPFKDLLSMFKDMAPAERAILTSIVDEMYDRFVDVVADGRKMDRDRVYEIADGRIYSARQALDKNMVDAIGTVEDAYEVLEELCEVDSARIVEHRRRPNLSEMLFGVRAAQPSLDGVAAQLLQSATGPRFLYYWAGAR